MTDALLKLGGAGACIVVAVILIQWILRPCDAPPDWTM